MSRMMRSASRLVRKAHLNTLPQTPAVGVYPLCLHVRGYKQHESKLVKELYRRRLEVGPEPWHHRSEFDNWNYDAEIFAFGKRLGIDLSDAILKRSFTHRSYKEKESNRRKDLGVDDSDLDIETNDLLIASGEENGRRCLTSLLKIIYPLLKEYHIDKIHRELWNDELFAHIGKNLGMTDLILSEDSPPETVTISNTFKAFLGGVNSELGERDLELILKDFVIPQLIGKDIAALINFKNPMGELMEILEKQGRGLPEPRLLWQSGCSTILAVYHVGIYSDRKLIGRSPGETVMIAEEEAAKDALKRLYRIEDHRPPLPVDSNSYMAQVSQ